jgi:transcriptional regulator with XRE-family HTH domain
MFKITLRMARELAGYTVEEVAGICGVSVDDVKMYESDTRVLPFELARVMKRLYHIKLEQIYIGLELEYVLLMTA